MNREELIKYIFDVYNESGDTPWIKSPNYIVFRHTINKKWFAIIMDIKKSYIGLEGDEKIDVVNLKCHSLITGMLLEEKGFYPAYHMNKENWVTAVLDKETDVERLKWLIEMSFELTQPKL